MGEDDGENGIGANGYFVDPNVLVDPELERRVSELNLEIDYEAAGVAPPTTPAETTPIFESPSGADSDQIFAMDRYFDSNLLRFHDESDPDNLVLPEAFAATEGYLRGFTGNPSVVLQLNDASEQRRLDDLVVDFSDNPIHRFNLADGIRKQLDRTDTPGELTLGEHKENGATIYVATYQMAPGGHPIASVAVASTTPYTLEEQRGLRQFLGWNDSHLAWATVNRKKNMRIETQNTRIAELEERIVELESGVTSEPVTESATEPAYSEPAPEPVVPQKITLLTNRPKQRADLTIGMSQTLVDYATDESYLRRVSEAAASKFEAGNNNLNFFSFLLPRTAEAIYTVLKKVAEECDSFDDILVRAKRPMYELLPGEDASQQPNLDDVRGMYLQALKSGKQPDHAVAKTLLWHAQAHYVPKLLSLGFDAITPASGVDVDINSVSRAITQHPRFAQEFKENHMSYIVALAMNDIFSGVGQYDHHMSAFPSYFFSRSAAEGGFPEELVGVVGAVADVNEKKTIFGLMQAEDELGVRFQPTLPQEGIKGLLDWGVMYGGIPRRMWLLRQSRFPRLDHVPNLQDYEKEFSNNGRENFGTYLGRLKERPTQEF